MHRTSSAMAVCALLLTAPAIAMAGDQTKPTADQYAESVLTYARTDLQSWITDPAIIFAIKEQNERNKSLSVLGIRKLDKMWIESDSHGPLIAEMLDRQASIIARDRRALSQGVITEIIVMDAHGLNVAISDRTSDAFQGDEAKYKETFLKGPEAVHVSDLDFDESTQKVQTQVSLTVTDPETGDAIGAVTLGIDLTQLTTLTN